MAQEQSSASMQKSRSLDSPRLASTRLDSPRLDVLARKRTEAEGWTTWSGCWARQWIGNPRRLRPREAQNGRESQESQNLLSNSTHSSFVVARLFTKAKSAQARLAGEAQSREAGLNLYIYRIIYRSCKHTLPLILQIAANIMLAF